MFLVQNLNNLVSFKTPVVERWLIQMKIPVAAPAFLILSPVLFMIDRMTAQIKVVRKVASNRGMTGMTVFPQQYIYIYIYIYICTTTTIFVQLANEFNPSCLPPTFVKKGVSNRTHEI